MQIPPDGFVTLEYGNVDNEPATKTFKFVKLKLKFYG